MERFGPERTDAVVRYGLIDKPSAIANVEF
jgi:hypothetical protein